MSVAFEMLVFSPERLPGLLLFPRSWLFAFQGRPYFLLDQLLQNLVQHLFALVPKRRVPEIMANRGAFHHLRIDDQARVPGSIDR
ncbi:hypothetical protein D3C74_249090 [compost metagenome]